MRLFVVVACALLVSGCGQPKPYRARTGLAYGPAEEQQFDHYRPVGARAGLAPVVVAIHGGAWQGGGRGGFGEGVAERFCPLGYDVVSIDYRLAPKAQWPAQLDDVTSAVAFLHSAGAAMGMDPARIGLFGHSAGGHLASITHLRTRLTVCAVSAAGEGDLRVYGEVPVMGDEDQILSTLLGERSRDPAVLADLSPAAWARPDASLMLVHAVGDQNVHVDQSRRLYASLREVGARDAWIVEAGGADHNSVWKEGSPWNALKGFLGARLGPERPRYSAEWAAFEAARVVE